jgi:hypothetical protein
MSPTNFYNDQTEDITKTILGKNNNQQVWIENSPFTVIKKEDSLIETVNHGETLFITSNKDLQFLYGYNQAKFLDVTEIVNSSKTNGVISLRGSKDVLFGDPFPYIEKSLYIKNGDTLNTIGTNTDCVIVFVNQEELVPVVEKFTRQSIFKRIMARNAIRNQ